MIGLRHATIADSDRLLRWRNDVGTMRAFWNTQPITKEEHDRWMQFHVLNGYPTHLVLIAEGDSGPIGVVRFDAKRKDVMTYDVSITIAPEYRDKGYGHSVLQAACDTMPEVTIRADVKDWNIASRRIFLRCGFEETGNEDGVVSYERGPR